MKPTAERMADLACDEEHLKQIVTLWAENTLVHQLAARLLAVREAQPVGISKIIQIAAELVKGDLLSALWQEAERSKIIRTERLQRLLDDAGEAMKVRATQLKQACEHPAAPAPAVPDFGALTKEIVENLVDCGAADDEAIAQYEEFVYKACRAAMRC